MAIKRIFTKSNAKAYTCLSCGAEIERSRVKDNTTLDCNVCGELHLVDVYGVRIVFTRADKKEFRRRQKQISDKAKIEWLEDEMAAARKEAEEWKAAAEGLAHIIEETNEKERTGENADIGTV